MRPKGLRVARMNEAVKEALSVILLTRTQDPRLRACIVTQVICTPDLSLATVFYRAMSPADEHAALAAALENAAPYLRREVQADLKMRTAPELRFRYDELPDEAARIEHLLETLP